MDDDWDLHAVVRGCAATSSTTASTTTTTTTAAAAAFKDSPSTNSQLFSSFNQNHILSTLPFQDLFQPITQNSINEELHDLYKPFVPKIPESSQRILLSPHRFPISPLSVLQDLSSEQQLTKQLPQTGHKQQLFSIGTGSKPNNPSPRPSKKRKNNLKKVCHVSAENLSSDNWSWRKYGQKPIKGSPYPRGYYKCSTLKGCMARKQVERNRSDPGMFIVTYTADHNHPMPTHRSSLAGNSRPKPDENSPKSDEPKKPSCSSETSPEANFSPAPEKLESSRDDVAEDEEDDFLVSDMAVDDDFFAGLEDFTGGGECDSGQFPASLRLPWSVDNSTAAATGSR